MEENKKWHFRTEELCVGYGQQQVLAQVNLQVEAGEILTLIGPNGENDSPNLLGGLLLFGSFLRLLSFLLGFSCCL